MINTSDVIIMATNNSTEAVPAAMANQTNFFTYAAIALRFIASFATITNICVLLLLIRLKKKFRNYSYWFQILVLSSEDLFNGLASLSLTFFDLELFRTSAIACSVILFAYACSQINTLLGICCICVNRFRSIRTIDRLKEPNFGYQQEFSLVFAALFSIVYSLLPFLIFPLNRSVMPLCSAPTLLGPNIQAYKLMLAFGLIIPLAIINVLYSICLVKLRRVNTKIRPIDRHSKSDYVTRAPMTEETHEGTSESKEKSHNLKTDSGDSHENIPNVRHDRNSHQERSKMAELAQEQAQAHSNEDCSISATADTARKIGKSQRLTTRVRASTRETQSRAVKLLGIILFLTNITVIIPVSLLLRDTFAPELQTGGSSSLGLIMLALNSLVDAFVYGFFAVEIRTYIHAKLGYIGRLFCPRLNATG